MYFNFEENHPDTPRLDSSLTILERVLLTTVLDPSRRDRRSRCSED